MSEPKNVGGYIVRRTLSYETEFVQLRNAHVRDKRLSFKARGIWAHLLSHAEGHPVTLQDLADSSTEGLASIRTGVEELEYLGYLVRTTVRAGKGEARKAGTYATRWELREPALPMFEVPREGRRKSTYENRTRSTSTFENRTTPTFENRTHKEHHLRTLNNSPTQGDQTNAHAVEEVRSSPATPAPATRPESVAEPTFEPCSRRPFMPCAYTSAGVCVECGEQQLAVDPITGEVA